MPAMQTGRIAHRYSPYSGVLATHPPAARTTPSSAMGIKPKPAITSSQKAPRQYQNTFGSGTGEVSGPAVASQPPYYEERPVRGKDQTGAGQGRAAAGESEAAC